MAIYLPGTAEEEQVALDELTPREIVVKLDDVADKAELNAEERLLDLLLPGGNVGFRPGDGSSAQPELLPGEASSRTREKLRQQLREGKLDDRIVELEVREKSFPAFEI